MKYKKAQPLLPQAVGNEEEESEEMMEQRISQRLPRITWNEVSDFSSSDSEEESECRTKRERMRQKELDRRNIGLQKARRVRLAGPSPQGKSKHASRREGYGDESDEESASRFSKSPRLTRPTTPTRRREEGSVPLSTPRPRHVAALMKEGGYKV